MTNDLGVRAKVDIEKKNIFVLLIIYSDQSFSHSEYSSNNLSALPSELSTSLRHNSLPQRYVTSKVTWTCDGNREITYSF